jgi:uncharacterized membrane protein YjjB (DUF3815 family)
MGTPDAVINSVWAGLFAASLGGVFTAAPRALIPSFFCGFFARLVRNLLLAWGLNLSLSVAIAAAVAVVIASIFSRRGQLSTAVLITGIIPLGAAVALFSCINDLVLLASLKGEALTAPSLDLVENFSTLVVTTVAIALGILTGYIIATPLAKARGPRQAQPESDVPDHLRAA